MNYALILAGGTGTRMGNTGIPKQFLSLKEKPIIIYTLKKILEVEEISHIIIVCNNDYKKYLQDLLIEYDILEKIYITNGGNSRIESVLNGLEFIQNNFEIEKSDICLILDSVRPFVSTNLILENIKYAKKYGAATTAVELIETVIESDENNCVKKIFERSNMYSDQSPQAFNIHFFLEASRKVEKDKLKKNTDLAEIITLNNGTVYIVKGERKNIKITTPIDLTVANKILEQEGEEKI